METPELSTKLFVNARGALCVLFEGKIREVIGTDGTGMWLLKPLFP